MSSVSPCSSGTVEEVANSHVAHLCVARPPPSLQQRMRVCTHMRRLSSYAAEYAHCTNSMIQHRLCVHWRWEALTLNSLRRQVEGQ